MSQKTSKKKSKKSSKGAAETSVLGNLRSTRPDRLGGDRRGSAAGARSSTTATKPAPKRAATKSKPKAKKAAKPKAAAAQRPTTPPPPPRESDGRPSGTEIVTTAVQAAGELAQIGVTVGSQLLKRAAQRIPRP
jgi:hypothetical protein